MGREMKRNEFRAKHNHQEEQGPTAQRRNLKIQLPS